MPGKILQALQAGASPNVVYSENREMPISPGPGSPAVPFPLYKRLNRGVLLYPTDASRVRSGRASAVLSLLEHGADPNLERVCGGCPVLAVSSNSLELTEILLHGGARDLPGIPCLTPI